MIARPALVFAALLAIPAAAHAQEASTKPGALQQAIGDPDDFTLSGSVRGRYETIDNQFRSGDEKSEDDFLFRTTLAAEYHSGPIRIGAELWDSRGYDLEPDTPIGASDINALELVQAYAGVDLGGALGKGSHTSVAGGRFLLNLGSGRLVGINNFGNTTNAFTGLRADFTAADKTALTLFYTLPQVHLPSAKADVLDNKVEWDRESFDLQFWGGFLSKPNLTSGLSVELYLFGLDERDRPDTLTTNRHLITPGLRLYRDPKPGHWDYEFEGAYQFGDVRTSTAPTAPKVDVSAYYVHAEVAHQFAGAWQPRISLEYDLASGDKQGSTSYNRFDSLFGPRRSDWGPSGLYGALGRSNISSPGVRLEVTPNKRWDGFVFYRAAWLDSATDSFASTGLKDANGKSGSFAGQQIEGRLRYWIVPRLLRVDTGAALLINGRFLKDAPKTNGYGNPILGYLDLTATF